MNSSFLLSNVSDTTMLFNLGLASSSACNDLREIPKTSTPLSRAVSEITFINPTLPPPKTTFMPFLAINSATDLAALAYSGFLPS